MLQLERFDYEVRRQRASQTGLSPDRSHGPKRFDQMRTGTRHGFRQLVNWHGGSCQLNARMRNNDKENLALAQQFARKLIGQELRQLYKETEELPEGLWRLLPSLIDVARD